MRKLNTADLFCAARAVKRSGMREELKKLTKNIQANSDIEEVGMDTIFTIIEVFAEKQAEQTIYEVLSGPFEMAAEDVANLDLSEIMVLLEELAKDEGLNDFFRQLSGILGKN